MVYNARVLAIYHHASLQCGKLGSIVVNDRTVIILEESSTKVTNIGIRGITKNKSPGMSMSECMPVWSDIVKYTPLNVALNVNPRLAQV